MSSISAKSALTPSLLEKIRSAALDLGFDHLSVTAPIIPSRDQDAYRSWSSAGFASGMDYMVRHPEKRLNVGEAYPDVKSVLTLGVSYYQGPLPPKPGAAFGRVARYAWGLDYHTIILERLMRLMNDLHPILGGAHAALAVDSKPLLERALAAASGLGFVGKNTVLIVPQSEGRRGFHVGSYVFLAEIILDMPVEAPPVSDLFGCGSCTKCLTACPTAAFESPYRLNADRCISYLTIENKGEIRPEMREAVGDWLFGCDVCQDVCPFNARAFETRWPEFKADRGVGPWVSLQEILSIPSAAEFKMKFGLTPLMRAKRRGVLRNACVVAGNSGDTSLLPVLKERLSDEEPLIRSHAQWAISKLA